jgi:hypothetical protein
VADDEGFRIESATHPEVVSAAHLTKQPHDRRNRNLGSVLLPWTGD